MPTATRKPASRQAARTPARSPAPANSKAAQAAQHQGRAVPPPQQAQRQAPPAEPRRSTALAAPNSANLPADLPARLAQYVGSGLEQFGAEDMAVPRIKLIQGTSTVELEQYDNLRPGNFFHTMSEHIFDAPFKVVPLFIDKQFVLWNPLGSGGGILARATDAVHWSPSSGKFEVTLDKAQGGHRVMWEIKHPTVAGSGLANWGTMNPTDRSSPPAATLMYNVLVAFPEEPDLLPALMTFQRSSVTPAKHFISRLKGGRYPMFMTQWTINAKNNQKGERNWFTIEPVGAGIVTEDELLDRYCGLHEQFKARGLTIRDLETVGDDPAADTVHTGADAPGTPSY